MTKGRQWELQLEAQNNLYRKEGRAVVWKTEPRRDRTGKYVEKAPPDFCGVVAGGQAVVFDAKDCKSARFSFSQIKRHQAKDLEAAHLRGALAFIALRFHGVGYFVPWTAIRIPYQRWVQGSRIASLGAAEIVQHTQLGGPFAADWIAAASEWEVAGGVH